MSKTKPLVAVVRRIPEAGLALLSQRYEVKVGPSDRDLAGAELYKFVKGADAVLSVLTNKVDAAFLEACGKQLRVVANYAVGFDNIDLMAAKKKRVTVTNTPAVSTESVAEHAIALMLAVAKRLVESDAYLRAGKYRGWSPELLLGHELFGKTLGILGLGRIGTRVAEIAALGLGMKVIYFDEARKNKDLDARVGSESVTMRRVLTASDVVSLHVPLTGGTRHLIGKTELASMKKTAILINTARGPVVDEAALIAALKSKVIWGAGLDVFEFEPKVSPALRGLPNVVLTPHTASSTQEARDAMAVLAAKNIIAVLEGHAPLTPAK